MALENAPFRHIFSEDFEARRRVTVFVETGDWVFERRVVELSLEEGLEVALSSGVKPGEQVVIKGGILLND